jgi:hypothetical protein
MKDITHHKKHLVKKAFRQAKKQELNKKSLEPPPPPEKATPPVSDSVIDELPKPIIKRNVRNFH